MDDTVVVNIRGVPREVRGQFVGGAAARGLSLSEYLERLLELHERSDPRLLRELGIERVAV